MCLLILPLLLAAPQMSAAASEPTYTDPVMHCAFRVPPGWRRLTREELEGNLAALEKQSGSRPTYDAWFLPADSGVNELPYLVVACQRCPMPTLREIHEVLARNRKDELETLKARTATDSARLTEPIIDARRNCVTYSQEVHRHNGDVVHTDVVIFPGQAGVVRLYFFHLQPESHLDKVARQGVLDSFRFKDGFEYITSAEVTQPTANPSFLGRSTAVLLVVALVIGYGCWQRTRRGR